MKLCVHNIEDESRIPFRETFYSAVKYGSYSHTRAMAVEMANVLINHLEANNIMESHRKLLITGAPYNQVPVASTALADFIAVEVNKWLIDKKKTVKTFKVERQHSYHEDYGKMSKEERNKSITSEDFYFDCNLLDGDPYVVLIDDIRITGAHEERMETAILDACIPVDYCFLYYAMLTDPTCCPTLEHRLNFAAIGENGERVYDFMWYDAKAFEKPLLVNTRLTKYLLRLEEDRFRKALRAFSVGNLHSLMKSALANGYAYHELYKNNYQTLSEVLENEHSVRLS